MIVAVCADKGAPGVTTAAVALALVWPGQRLVVEADPSGGDLAFRARHPETSSLLRDDRGLLALAADARVGVPPDVLTRYAQPTSWGVDVICGPSSAASYAPMRSLWPGVADALAAWPGTAVTDLGRLYPGSPAIALAQRATAIVVLTAVTVESLFHLRDRLPELASQFGDPSRAVSPLAVVTLARRRDAGVAVQQVTRVLESVGCPVPSLGSLAIDRTSAQQLREGRITPRVARGHLLRSAADIVTGVLRRWPHLADANLAEAAAS